MWRVFGDIWLKLVMYSPFVRCLSASRDPLSRVDLTVDSF